MFTVQSIHVSMELWGAIFCFIASFCMYYNTGMEEKKRKLLLDMEFWTAVLMVADSCAWAFRGEKGNLAFVFVRVSNFIVFLLSDVILLLVHAYVCVQIFNDKKLSQNIICKKISLINQLKSYGGWNYVRVKLVYLIGSVGIILVIFTQFTGPYYYFDENNLYHRNTWHPLSLLIGLVCMGLDLSLLIQNRKKLKRQIYLSIISYFVFPMLASVALIFYYGISLVNISVTISMMCMFVVTTVEQGKELANTRIEVMLSQIQPHFIYNALTTIKYLCRHDPDTAVQTVDEFSKYLRGNIDSMTVNGKIPFEKELEHTKSYLSIEQKRFGDRVSVVYDIEEKDFLVPALILQPIVENAVKHGICKKEDGGTVRITTRRTMHAYVITVEDDGVGYDTEHIPDDGKVHVGMKNVRERISAMCHGKMIVESTPGVGTTVEIRIPVIKHA